MFLYLVFALLLGIVGVFELIRASGREPGVRQNPLIHAGSNLALAFAAWEAHTAHVGLAWAGLSTGVAMLIWWAAVCLHTLFAKYRNVDPCNPLRNRNPASPHGPFDFV